MSVAFRSCESSVFLRSLSQPASLGFPVGGATGVLYARRSADGISHPFTHISRRSRLVTLTSHYAGMNRIHYDNRFLSDD